MRVEAVVRVLGQLLLTSSALSMSLSLSTSQMTVLDEALTVLDMTTKAWDAQSELVLYFRLRLK